MRAARTSPGRRALLGLLLLPAAVVFAAAPPSKPAKPVKAAAPEPEKPKKAREMPGEAVEFKTTDGWTLKGHYLPAEKDLRTFLLLHEAGGSEHNWYWFARKLQRRGMGMLALDFRGHGASQSGPPGEPSYWRKFRVAKDNNDWDNMREDISSAVAFLKEKGVDPSAVGLIGASVGSSIAIRYAALHPEVPLVLMLSPGLSYQNVPTVNALRAYKDRPLLMVVGDDDERTAKQVPIMFRFAQLAAGEGRAFLLRVPKGHGTRILVFNRGVMDSLLDWVASPDQPPAYELATSSATASGAAGAAPAPAGKPAVSSDGLPTEEEMDQEYGEQQQQSRGEE